MHGDAANRVGRTGGTEVPCRLHPSVPFGSRSSCAGLLGHVETAFRWTAPMESPNRARTCSTSTSRCCSSRLQPLGLARHGSFRPMPIEPSGSKACSNAGSSILGSCCHRCQPPLREWSMLSGGSATGRSGDDDVEGLRLQLAVDHRHVVVERRSARQRLLMDRADDDEAVGASQASPPLSIGAWSMSLSSEGSALRDRWRYPSPRPAAARHWRYR